MNENDNDYENSIEYEIEKGNEILRSIIGSKFHRNENFIEKLRVNGVFETSKAWRKINSQIQKELNHGVLKSQNVATRIDNIILSMSERNEIITVEDAKNKGLNNVKSRLKKLRCCYVMLPYINDEVVFDLNLLNKENVKWIKESILFKKNGFEVELSEYLLEFNCIKTFDVIDKNYFNTTVNITQKNGENFIFKSEHNLAIVIKDIIGEYNSNIV